MAQDARARGHASRRLGFYGESVVQAIASAAGLRVSKEVLEPEGVDLQIIQVRPNGRPKRQRIEIQVKSRSALQVVDHSYRVPLKQSSYHQLNGTVGVDFDIGRYLILVTTPPHFSEYHKCGDDHLRFYHRVYWANLMGMPSLPIETQSTTVSVPTGNLLTAQALVELVCGNREEAARWMSA